MHILFVPTRSRHPRCALVTGVQTSPRPISKGKLKGGLARALHGGDFTDPADLGALIAAQLQRATLDRLGLEARAGTLILGNDRIEEAARRGRVHLLLHAADAGEDGRRKLAQAWRVGEGDEGSSREGLVLPVDRNALSMALGRENAVHLALTDARAADRSEEHTSRWQVFTGWFRDAANRGPDADSRSAGNEAEPTASAAQDAAQASGLSMSYRKSVVSGRGDSGRVDLGGGRFVDRKNILNY